MDDIELFDVPEEVKSDLRMKLLSNDATWHTKDSLITFFKSSHIDYAKVLPFLTDRTEKVIYDVYDKAVYILDWSENGFITTFKRL
ncbi:hypothetical protein [Vagococcus bubulae]|uniref:Uncharacterized protein n=1 Tax=Vagococcus bubulae TaxID=1977868 RepID=A0A429ZA77_9ENTE|nr:hypothetical protein [Vagococcus bubulae]RST90583.1 hypothetical protein CBF36_11505 [Vagococcus bubulae]